MSEANPYAPPVQDLAPAANEQPIEADALPVFPTSQTKLLVMFFATFGIYEVYWNYKQWQAHRARTGEDLMPFWRAVFSIFWVHKLFRSIGGVVGVANTDGLATVYVVLNVIGRVADRLGLGLVGFVSFGSAFPLSTMQGHINAYVAQHYPNADRNDRFSAANIVCIVLGLMLWAAVLAGLLFAGAAEN